jgi:hypothetical protein
VKYLYFPFTILIHVFVIFFLSIFIDSTYAQSETPIAIVSSVEDSEIIIKGKIGENLKIGSKAYIIDGKNIILLEVYYPMIASGKCRVIKGSPRNIRAGMQVFKGSPASSTSIDDKSKESFEVEEFVTLIGFSHGDSIDQMFKKLGPATIENNSKNDFDTAYWEIKNNKIISANFIRSNRKIKTISLGKSYQGISQIQILKDFLHSKGINDKKTKTLGSTKNEIIKMFGSNYYQHGGTYSYNKNVKSKYLIVDFICEDVNLGLCSEVIVHWID